MSIGWNMITQAVPGSYDVILKTSGGRQRDPRRSVSAATSAKGSSGRKKVGIKILAFAAGTLASFGIGSALKAAGVTSGLTRTAITLGVSYVGTKVGSRLSGAPGTFAYGVALGGALFSAYEGWGMLSDAGELVDGIAPFSIGSGLSRESVARSQRAQDIIWKWLGF